MKYKIVKNYLNITKKNEYIDRINKFHRRYEEHDYIFGYCVEKEIEEWEKQNPPDYETKIEEYREDIDPSIVGFLKEIDGYEVKKIKLEKDEIIIECYKEGK